jgi:hypothetical protein
MVKIYESPDKGKTIYERNFGESNRQTYHMKESDRIVAEAPYQPGYEDAVPQPTQEIGRKFDGGKLMYGLLPPLALEETVKVLTFGAQKYEPDNWQFVPDSKRRYFDALQRHLWAWKQSEQIDQESGLPHLAHAMCCLMFLYEHDVKYSKE